MSRRDTEPELVKSRLLKKTHWKAAKTMTNYMKGRAGPKHDVVKKKYEDTT